MIEQWVDAVAGAVAGLATTAALYPLDIVRTRFQAHDGRDPSIPRYRSTVQALVTIARFEGAKGLYAGFLPAAFGSSLSWGLYFYFYSNAKSRHEKRIGAELGPCLHLLSAAEAGALACALTNPIWLVKTRLQLQAPGHGSQRPYTGFLDAFARIVRTEGLRGLYKGFTPSLLLVSHGALQFMAYEEGKKALVSVRNKPLTSVDYAVLGGSSKLFAVVLTYPYQVIRTRIQQRPNKEGVSKYKGVWHAFMETTRYEGVRGIYKGIAPTLLRVLPYSSIKFVVYEACKNLLIQLSPND